MPKETFWNPNTRRYETRDVTDKGEVESALAKEKFGSTAGKGLGSKAGSSEGMPKQQEGESAAAYGERLRQWREEQKKKPLTQVQSEALRKAK